MCFVQPTDQNSIVWRYMDFTKFFSLVSTESLFLCRADLLGDPFEGSFSKANIKLRPEVYKVPKPQLDKMQQQMANVAKGIRQWTYINCWHASEYESAAMWRLYAKSNEAVAIQTTYRNLTNSLPDNVFIGLVQYIDYEKDWLPEGNIFFPFMHKRKSFAHEREVRIIHQDLPTSEKGINVNQSNDLKGISVTADLNLLIERVYVAPTVPKWYFNLVEEVLKKYKINKKVYSSKLDEEPVY
jgi:hypothetical protein